MGAHQVAMLVLIVGGAMVVLGGMGFLLRWWFHRRIPKESLAVKPMTGLGKLHALSMVVSILGGLALTAVFPQSWFARLLESIPAAFAFLVLVPAVILSVILEARGAKLYGKRSNDA